MGIEDDSKFEIVDHFNEQRVLKKQEALQFIGTCIGQLGQLGANDSELPAIFRIRDELTNGTLEPATARQQVEEIMSRKNPYH